MQSLVKQKYVAQM